MYARVVGNGRVVRCALTDHGATVASVEVSDGRIYRVVGRPRRTVDGGRHEVNAQVDLVVEWLRRMGL